MGSLRYRHTSTAVATHRMNGDVTTKENSLSKLCERLWAASSACILPFSVSGGSYGNLCAAACLYQTWGSLWSKRSPCRITTTLTLPLAPDLPHWRKSDLP